jgi:hypothetical protein
MLDFLRKLFRIKKRESANRIYDFPLPYVMTATIVFYAVPELQREGAFSRLPQDIQERLLKARDQWHSLRITADDLNRIDDATWTRIAQKLGLKWRKA